MRSFLASLVVLLSVVNVPAAVASPEGQMSFALQVSLAPMEGTKRKELLGDVRGVELPFGVIWLI